jgi:signal peptidase II
VINRGISWGMFHSSNLIVFVAVSLLIGFVTFIVLLHALYCFKKNVGILGHVLVITGSLSNLIDRALYGGVIDFIILSYHYYTWPVFNCADIAIVCGVGIMLWNGDNEFE